MDTTASCPQSVSRTRWAARTVSVAVIVWWTLISYFHISSGEYLPGSWILFGLAWVACLGLLAAWRWERIGARVAVGAAIALAAFVIYLHTGSWRANALAGGLSLALQLAAAVALPFLTPGLLFLMAARWER